MKLQQLYSYTRKAIDHYQLIESGDKIAIGISGGKDSLTLLYALEWSAPLLSPKIRSGSCDRRSWL